MIGIRKASVLPDPVPVATTVGNPVSMRRTASPWCAYGVSAMAPNRSLVSASSSVRGGAP